MLALPFARVHVLPAHRLAAVTSPLSAALCAGLECVRIKSLGNGENQVGHQTSRHHPCEFWAPTSSPQSNLNSQTDARYRKSM